MLRRILVGLDGSPLAETILQTVRALAARLGSEIVLLHVTHVPEMVRAMDPGPTLGEVVEQERVRAQSYLEKVTERIAGAGFAVQTAVCAGEAAAEIVRYAERERVDLIALATHGRSGMQRWVYGSVADAVLHGTTTPLLLLLACHGGPERTQVRSVTRAGGEAAVERRRTGLQTQAAVQHVSEIHTPLRCKSDATSRARSR